MFRSLSTQSGAQEMGRKANLPSTIFDHDFASLAKRESNARTRIRLLGLNHVRDGQSYEKIAIFLDVHAKSVSNWVERTVVSFPMVGGLHHRYERCRVA
jgi:hypothetical protein